MDKNDKQTTLIIFFVFLLYYAFNCPPNVTVEDSGDFIMGLSTLGIVHGPSFPLFTMLGFLFSKIPLGEVGFRIALFSATFGALGLSLFYILLRLWKQSFNSSLLATVTIGLSTVYMGQSIIAEVYSLNVVFVLLLFIFTLKANSDSRPLWIFLMGLVTGSGLIHHYPIFLASCTGLVFIFDWKSLTSKKVFIGFLGILLGVLPFCYLLVQMKNPDLAYNFGKVANWEMLWKQFLRKGYEGVDKAGGGFTDKLLLSVSVLKLYLTDFGLISIFMPLGFISFKKSKEDYGLLICWLTSSFLIVFLLGFTAEAHYEAVIKAYLLPHFLFCGLYISKGYSSSLEILKQKGKYLFQITIVCSLLMGVINFKDTTHYNDNFIYLWAKKGLESLEKNSILILCGQEPYALYYVNQFLKVRPDVTIYDRLSIMTKENLYSPHLLFWKVKTQEQFDNYRKKRELDLFKTSNRPIYLTCSDKFAGYGVKIEQTAYFYRLKNHIPFDIRKTPQAVDKELLSSAVSNLPRTEYWLDAVRNMFLFNTYSFYLKNNPSEIDHYLKKLLNHKNSSEQDFMHALLEHTYKAGKLSRYADLINWNIKHNGIENFQSGTLSRLCTVKATEKKLKEAYSYCVMAQKKSKDCNVSLLNNLLFISYGLKKMDLAKTWAKRILKCKPTHKGANSLLKSIN